MSIARTITGDLRVMGQYRGLVGCDVLTGWERGAILNLDGSVDRDVDGNAVYPVGARLDNPPFPTAIFDTLTGPSGMLAQVGRSWDRAITMRRNAGDPLAMEEWVRIADLGLSANTFDQHLTTANDIAKKVRDL